MYDIDLSWFYIEFIVNPEKLTAEKLRANNEILSVFNKQTNTKFNVEPIHICTQETELFNIFGVIKELISIFQLKNKRAIKFVKTIARAFSLVSVCIPIIYKMFEFRDDFFYNSMWYEHVITLIIAYLQYSLYYFSVWTLLHGIIDM